ncbi:hypothetical protein UA08_01647 [Talaromyces atroroseus]|uniref:NADP-dependent oxidoreductase domain-containing protein n=1 Tax=Talaromyces atroroseus TaxID=1441469 RepID=A0A1Q5Q9V1_TALAT|nr:hypothetical protein UA08_01647 [Talaromyces atroroseus]OKL62706.1 hypothetical protein UA08_01647 [Talaromyces atroroseus]
MTAVIKGIPTSLQKSLDATKVEYVRLGNSGLRVSWPILGTMAMGSSPYATWLLNREESLKVLKAAYDSGINTWDTSCVYSNGQSEEILGAAMRELNIPRQKVVIMTKCGKGYVNHGGLSRAAIFKSVDDSLARLGTNYIDLLQIHRFDPHTPLEETMRALHDLVQAGKVRYIGASSMWAVQFAQMQFIAEKHGWTKLISMQNYYNLCYREEEREMIRFCKGTGVGIIPWSPLFAGRLARPLGYDKSLRSKRPSPHHPGMTSTDEEIIQRVEKLANEKDWNMSDVALAWHKSKSSIPIVGLNSADRVEEMSGLKGKELTDDEVKYLEEPYVARAVAGHT